MTLRPGIPVDVLLGASLLVFGLGLLAAPTARTQALAQPTEAPPPPSYSNQILSSGLISAEPPTTPPVDETASLDSRVAAEGADVAVLDPELECMAKVVHHEAANQPLKGQLAVAQLILNRVKSPMFPKSICAVVNQRGQFFSTYRWPAPVRSPRWHTSVAIARIAREETVPDVVPGALFYHAAYARPSWYHRRSFVARIGDQMFYR